ncbi:MAG: hypothetical protein ACLFPQ_06100 [Candidatus Woesearchaeota archaeon]
MAYVFGIEGVPIFEILFVIIMLLFIGLIFVLLEVKKLKLLLTEESEDIQRFESDLGQFEKDEVDIEKSMERGSSHSSKSSGSSHSSSKSDDKPAYEIVNWVKSAKAKGKTDDQIMSSLTSAGWNKEEIQKAIDSFKK